VSLEAGKWPHRDEKDQPQPVFSDRKPIQNQKINCARVVDAKSRTCAGVPFCAAGNKATARTFTRPHRTYAQKKEDGAHNAENIRML